MRSDVAGLPLEPYLCYLLSLLYLNSLISYGFFKRTASITHLTQESPGKTQSLGNLT